MPTAPQQEEDKPCTQAAKIALETITESHHPAIATIILPIAKEIQDLRHKAYNKKQIIKKMEEEADFIPTSVRLKFTLKFADVTLKRMDEERKNSLETEAREATAAYQATMKGIIISAAKEELKASHAEVLEKTVELVHKATDTFITAEGIKDATVHDKAWNIMHHYGARLFKHHKQDLPTIQTKYIDVYQLEDATQPIALPNINREYDTPQARAQALATYNQNSSTPTLMGHLKLKKILEDVLVVPFNQCLTQIEENQRAIALKKKLVTLMEGPATEAAAMEIDQEMPTDRPTLQALITHAVREATAPLQKEITQLKKQPAPRNNSHGQSFTQRGRAKSGASNKKKSDKKSNQQSSNTPRKPRPRSRSRGVSVDSRGNASGGGKQNKRNGGSRRSSNRKSNNSNSRNNRSSR